MGMPVTETGVVVKLDRGFPLVRLADGRELRCEHATSLVKGSDQRAVVGDNVRKPCHGVPRSCEKTPRSARFPKRLPPTSTW